MPISSMIRTRSVNSRRRLGESPSIGPVYSIAK